MREAKVEADPTMTKAMLALSKAREAFKDAVSEGLILGNDNHIGDIGEYWVRKHLESRGTFKEYAAVKNAPYDLETTDGKRISVKTITDWSVSQAGTQVKPICGKDWQILAAVKLSSDLKPIAIALVPFEDLLKYEPFITNESNRKKKNTKSYPRFQWWSWLDKYIAYRHA